MDVTELKFNPTIDKGEMMKREINEPNVIISKFSFQNS